MTEDIVMNLGDPTQHRHAYVSVSQDETGLHDLVCNDPACDFVGFGHGSIESWQHPDGQTVTPGFLQGSADHESKHATLTAAAAEADAAAGRIAMQARIDQAKAELESLLTQDAAFAAQNGESA